jgi:hypothetical protein
MPLLESNAEPWNPRFVAYATAHGRSPEDMLAHDRQAHPGASMMEFSIWVQQQWRRFRESQGRRHDDRIGDNQDAFTAWLNQEVAQCRP